MSPLLERVIGLALILGAVAGLILNLAGLVFIPRVAQSVRQGTVETLTVLDGTLNTTAEGLAVVTTSLDNASLTMEAVSTTTRDVAQTVEDTAPLLDTFATLTGDELPRTIATTQLSLAAAQEGTQSIEVLLSTLNAVPLLGLPLYNPPVPLYQSLASVSASLEPLAASFVEVEESLRVAGSNLEEVEVGITTLANNLDRIDRSIADAKSVTEQYQQVVEDQQAVVARLQANLEPAITWGSRAVAMLLVWLAIAQVGLLSQGIEMVSRSRRRSVPA